MNCSPEEFRWLGEWSVFLLIVLAFGVAAAYRWAKAPHEEKDNDQEHCYEEVGECFDSEFGDVSTEAKAELQALLDAWAEKHVNLSHYWVIKGKSRELRVTEYDVKEHSYD